MKEFYFILTLILFACNQSQAKKAETYQFNHDTVELKTSVIRIDSLVENKKLRVIILPSYDKISNRGISPNTQEIIEEELSKSNKIELIEFPLKHLMHVPYQNIFHKKYCKPIIENVDCDIIVMTKLDLVEQTGNISRDSWNLRIRVFNIHTGIQLNSELKADSLSSSEIKKVLGLKVEILLKEIIRTVTPDAA